MKLDPLSWIMVISGIVALLLALLPSFADLRANNDGKTRITPAGRAALALAFVTFILSIGIQRITEQKETKEKYAADSASYALALSQTELIRGESEHLRALQQRALQQVDSVWTVSKGLEAQQWGVLADLRRNQSLSRTISDSLQQIVVFSRQLLDSLRVAETRAAGRTQATLALVERTSNPISMVSAPINLQFEPANYTSQLVIDSVFAQHTGGQSLPTGYMVSLNGRVQPARLPTEVVLTFWRSEDCQDPLDWERSLLTARRTISYDSAEFHFWTRGPDSVRSLSITWEQAPFSIATRRSVSVDDLLGACVYVDLEWHGMMSDATGRLWRAATVSIYQLQFPYGRRAIIRPESRIALQDELELLQLPSEF